MISILIVGSIVFLIYIYRSYNSETKQDEIDLLNEPINQKFLYLINTLNSQVFNNEGQIHFINKNELILHSSSKTQKINICYSVGSLILYYKAFSTFTGNILEVKKEFFNVRQISIKGQLSIADTIIADIELIIRKDLENSLHK